MYALSKRIGFTKLNWINLSNINQYLFFKIIACIYFLFNIDNNF